MKVNATQDHAVYEKIKVPHCFRFAAEGLIFFLNFNFTYTRQTMSQFGINFIHVINFSDVQNVLCISVMYVMSRVRICIGGVGAGKDLAQGAHKSVNGLLSEPAKHDLTLSRSLQNVKGTTSVFYIS